MPVIRWISLRERLILNYVVISVLAILIVGGFTYYIARNALMERTYQQLISVKTYKKNQLLSFLNENIREIRLMSGVISKKQDIKNNTGYNISNSEWDSEISEYLKNNNNCKGIIVGSFENNTGYKISAGKDNTTECSEFPLNQLPTGEIKSGLKNNPVYILDNIHTTDPSLLIIMPSEIELSGKKAFIGYYVNVDILDTIMLESNASKGLGKSGESYIVGTDRLLRTNSRFSKEYFSTVKVNTEGARQALEGYEGTGEYTDYRGINVLGSYGSISLYGIDWIILAEIDYKEAIVPIFILRNNILILTLIIAFIVFIFTFYVSKRITKPLIELKNAVIKMGEGKTQVVQVPSGNDELQELAVSFNRMSEELDNKRNELNNERYKRSRAMLDGQEQERQRLSRELHDGVGQHLAALKMQLQVIPVENPDNTAKKAEEISSGIDEVIKEIRNVSYDLRPASLNETGLSGAIRNLCSAASANSSISFSLSADEIPEHIGITIQTYIYRILQESIHNILKHSHARNAVIEIKANPGVVNISVIDDGKGFDTNKQFKGNGIYNIKERVNLLSGSIEINSKEGHGSEIKISIPVQYVE